MILVPTVMNRLQLKLLCPPQAAREIWNPQTQTNERRSNAENASHLCEAINALTKLDSGSKNGLELRVAKDPDYPDSEFVLTYP